MSSGLLNFTVAALLTSLLLLGRASSQTDTDADGQALGRFLQNALPEHARDSYNVSGSPCQWLGVSCSAGGRVEIVDIQAFGLRGSIPQDSIGKLSGLVRLNLFNNTISGAIPSDVWSLPSLQYLNLSSNQLSGSISIDSSLSSSLVVVDLSRNLISGQIPGAIGSLSRLGIFNLSKNFLQDQIPDSVSNCRQLKQLDLSSNRFTGNIPPGLGHLTLLEVLLLNGNALERFPQAELGRLHYLRILDLSNNKLIGGFPRLDGLRKLESFNVSGNLLSGILPNAAFRLPQLEILAARKNRLVGRLPIPSVTKANSLRLIDLGSNNFTGGLPQSLLNLSSIEILRLDNNNLEGHLPLELGASLRELDLRDNMLDGELPVDMASYQGLAFLDLSSNRLTGRLPENPRLPFLLHLGLGSNPFVESNFPKLLGSLEYLNLSATQLGGSLPVHIGQLHKLKQLDISHNKLSGNIPDSLGELKSLLWLDLSYNNLSGSLPSSLGRLTQVQRANFSYNEFSGDVPAWPFMVVSGVTGNRGLCGALVNTTCPKTTEKPAPGRRKTSRKHMRTAVIVGASTGGAAALLCVILAGVILCCKHGEAWWWCCCIGKTKKGPAKEERYISMSGPFSSEMDPSVWASGIRDPQTIPVVMFEKPLLNLSFADLVQATSNFSKDVQVPDAGWGPVFRGSLGGIAVAIKILGEGIACADMAEAAAQLAAIGRLKHPNVAPLLGYCMVGVERLLVYEYVQENGDLFGRLHELPEGVRNPEDWSTDTWENGAETQMQMSSTGGRLAWEARHKVALGTARALAFLHHGCCPPVVHKDVKAGNVLLDAEFEARLAGTGVPELVEIGPGEPGYVPPEQQQQQQSSTKDGCSPKGDVYAFGVILLELVTGKRPIGDDYNGDGNYGSCGSLVAWTRSLVKEKRGFKALDVRVMHGDEAETNEMLEALRIGYLCTADSPAKRPTMQQVVGLLKDLRPGGATSQGSQ